MYPTGELDALALRKAAVRLRIAGHRWQCVEAGAELARPLAWADDLWGRWRRISPIAKAVGAPVVLLVVKKLFGRFGQVASIARAVPLIFQTAKMVAGWKAKADA